MKTVELFPDFYESIRVVDRSIPFFSMHYKRMQHIISSFGLDETFISPENLETQIFDHLQTLPPSEYKIRLTLQVENNLLLLKNIESQALYETQGNAISPIKLTIYQDGFKDSRSPFSNFKTANRLLYHESLRYAQTQGCDQAIILNERNEIVETSICNIFLVKEGCIFTPPLSSGCVDGVMRRIMMEENEVIEKIICPEDLNSVHLIFLTNAVRGRLKADLKVQKSSF